LARKRKSRFGVMWIGGLAFAAGYLVTNLLQGTDYAGKAPTLATTVAVALTIPLAARARRVLHGALRGLGLGLAAAVGIALAMYKPEHAAHPEIAAAAGSLAMLVTMICCTIAGALFAYLAERRRRILYGQEE
jgi:hypothetical protein